MITTEIRKQAHTGPVKPTSKSRNQCASPSEKKVIKSSHYPRLAQQLFNSDLEPIPVTPGKKYWKHPKWQSISLPIVPWPKNHGISLRTGKLVGIDIDILDPDMIEELLKCFKSIEILKRVGKLPKTLIPVFCPEVTGKLLSDQWVNQNGELNRIEILSHGQQFVAYAIHPDTNKPYKWSGDLLTHDLPVIPLTLIELLFSRFNELAAAAGWTNITVKEKFIKKRYKSKTKTAGNKPGDLYNRCCPITDILKEYGWKHYRGNYWTRPEKERGVSGTVFDNNTFWCFTSSTCLTPDRSYDNFGLLTMYEHNGDFTAASHALRETMEDVA